MNGHARLAGISALAGLALLALGLSGNTDLAWYPAHGVVLVIGVVLPGLAAWHNISLREFATAPAPELVRMQVGALSLATLILGAGTLGDSLLPGNLDLLIGFAALLAFAIWSLRIHMACKPSDPLTNVELDPLTKGDDASFKHLKFAHFFLPLGVLFLAASQFGFVSETMAGRLWISGIHVALIGYGLLSLYGIGHLWVPRFSGVPAIAAGAIKGELHSTLPAMIFLPLGFLTGWVGFIIAGGAFAFLGFFTYMGVLGANIMRNKSVTHRVTPDFVYIPWTFSGIFWLVSGVLMGVIMTAVPDELADKSTSLRAVHVHINLLGGVLQLLVAWLTRYLPGTQAPPAFQGAMKGAFYAFNLAVAIAVGAMMAGGHTIAYVTALVLAALAGLAYMQAMKGFMRRPLSS